MAKDNRNHVRRKNFINTAEDKNAIIQLLLRNDKNEVKDLAKKKIGKLVALIMLLALYGLTACISIAWFTL